MEELEFIKIIKQKEEEYFERVKALSNVLKAFNEKSILYFIPGTIALSDHQEVLNKKAIQIEKILNDIDILKDQLKEKDINNEYQDKYKKLEKEFHEYKLKYPKKVEEKPFVETKEILEEIKTPKIKNSDNIKNLEEKIEQTMKEINKNQTKPYEFGK